MITLYDYDIKVRTHHCSKNGGERGKVDKPYVNIYVKVNHECNATCNFCEYRGSRKNFDVKKFKGVLKEISNNVSINKISFTGGEPTLYIELLEELIGIAKETSPSSFIVVNTNGYNLEKLCKIDGINSVALSRHHYDDKINNTILGFEAPSSELINNISNKDVIHFSCNLIKGLIDSNKEVIKYLDYAGSVGVKDIGFVSLMKVNDFCKEYHIDFSDIGLENELFRNRIWENGDSCKCANFLYNYNSDIIKIYSRYYSKQKGVESQLVFDGQHLRDGFVGPIIY